MASNGAANGAAAAGPADPVEEAKALVAELCAGLYVQGHVSGTGGGISIKVPTPAGDRIVMAPSGVQKERMRPQDMFVLDGASGAVLHTPEARPPPYKAPKLSECAPLFMSVRARVGEPGRARRLCGVAEPAFGACMLAAARRTAWRSRRAQRSALPEPVLRRPPARDVCRPPAAARPPARPRAGV